MTVGVAVRESRREGWAAAHTHINAEPISNQPARSRIRRASSHARGHALVECVLLQKPAHHMCVDRYTVCTAAYRTDHTTDKFKSYLL